MYPVFINGRKRSIDFDGFIANFLVICESHLEEDRASAFAFIIYDFNDPHLRKILMDADYWNTLDRLTGKFLTVFSLFEDPTKDKLKQILAPRKVKAKFEAVKVDTKKDLGSSYREIIEMFFGGTDFKSPSVLFFQVNEDKIIDYFFVELKQNKVEEGFNELKELIDKSVEAIEDITPENKRNYIEIFQMLEVSVNSLVWWKKSKRVVTKGINLISFLSIFKPA